MKKKKKKTKEFDARALTLLSIFAEQRTSRFDIPELADLVKERLEKSADHLCTSESIPSTLEIAISIEGIIKDKEFFEFDGWYISPTIEGLKYGEIWLKKVRAEWDR